jgi:hypothetical protein
VLLCRSQALTFAFQFRSSSATCNTAYSYQHTTHKTATPWEIRHRIWINPVYVHVVHVDGVRPCL